jgi:hypothetical protein
MQREARMKGSWLSEKVGYPDKDTRFVSYSMCLVISLSFEYLVWGWLIDFV